MVLILIEWVIKARKHKIKPLNDFKKDIPEFKQDSHTVTRAFSHMNCTAGSFPMGSYTSWNSDE